MAKSNRCGVSSVVNISPASLGQMLPSTYFAGLAILIMYTQQIVKAVCDPPATPKEDATSTRHTQGAVCLWPSSPIGC